MTKQTYQNAVNFKLEGKKYQIFVSQSNEILLFEKTEQFIMFVQ